MSYTTIQLDKTPAGIALVWLNRPEVRNAFNETTIAELTDAFRAVDGEAGTRAMVLAGHGPAFCAGADLNWMKKMSGYTFEQNYEDALGLARMLHTLHTMKKPTVARVHGAAFAGGMGLVAACDLAVGVESATFAVNEVRIGVIPAIISVVLLRKLMLRDAMELFLTGEAFDGRRAVQIGLLNSSVPADQLDAEVARYVEMVRKGAPNALAGAKRLVREVPGMAMHEAFDEMSARSAVHFASAEALEGMTAFAEKRQPAWQSE